MNKLNKSNLWVWSLVISLILEVSQIYLYTTPHDKHAGPFAGTDNAFLALLFFIWYIVSIIVIFFKRENRKSTGLVFFVLLTFLLQLLILLKGDEITTFFNGINKIIFGLPYISP